VVVGVGLSEVVFIFGGIEVDNLVVKGIYCVCCDVDLCCCCVFVSVGLVWMLLMLIMFRCLLISLVSLFVLYFLMWKGFVGCLLWLRVGEKVSWLGVVSISRLFGCSVWMILFSSLCGV